MLYGKKINAVPRTKTPEQALAALMRLCARAERSEEDARRLMTRWGVAPADRERVLERLRREVRTTRAATPYELKNKLIRYGLAQGYDYEAVRDAADALIATTDDSCDTFF